jgi:hypothetical protein
MGRFHEGTFPERSGQGDQGRGEFVGGFGVKISINSIKKTGSDSGFFARKNFFNSKTQKPQRKTYVGEVGFFQTLSFNLLYRFLPSPFLKQVLWLHNFLGIYTQYETNRDKLPKPRINKDQANLAFQTLGGLHRNR